MILSKGKCEEGKGGDSERKKRTGGQKKERKRRNWPDAVNAIVV